MYFIQKGYNYQSVIRITKIDWIKQRQVVSHLNNLHCNSKKSTGENLLRFVEDPENRLRYDTYWSRFEGIDESQ